MVTVFPLSDPGLRPCSSQASWVSHVFGPQVGGHNTYWIFVGYVVESALFPLLAGQYISSSLSQDS